MAVHASSAPVLRTRSPELAREHIAGVFAAHRLACVARELDFVHERRGRAVSRLRYGAQVIVDAPALERFYLLQLTLAGSCEIVLGRRTAELRAGDLMVVNPTRPYRKRWSADCAQLIARIDRGLVEAAWTARFGAPPRHALEFAMARMPDAAARRLGAMLRGPERGAAHDRLLAEALVATLPPAEAGAPVPAADVLVRRAEGFMEAHLAEELTMTEIAQAAGATTRSLERAFRRSRGATAVASLRRLRLERARRELVAARGSDRSVTEVASAVGLLHAGRFAVDYRSLFGESPSATLRGAGCDGGRDA